MLQKYKQGELSEEQMEKVEADLLQQMFRRQEDNRVRENLKRLAAIASNEADSAGNNAENTRMTVVHRGNKSWTWLAAAASVALLAVASWWIFIKPKPSEPLSTVALADTYLKNDATPVWTTTMGGTTEEREAKAKEAYDKKDFDNAIGLFEAIPPSKKEHYFYLGIAALKQQKPDATKAVDNLLTARTLANGWEEDATNWYLALAYLKLGKTVEARAELNNIVKIGRDNVGRATELLSVLRD